MDVARTSTGHILYLAIIISRWGEKSVTVYNPFHSFINMEKEQYFENIRQVGRTLLHRQIVVHIPCFQRLFDRLP